MKVINSREIKTGVNHVIKSVEKLNSTDSRVIENSGLITNSLEVLSNSAKACLNINPLSKMELLIKNNRLIKHFENSEGLKNFIQSKKEGSTDLKDLSTMFDLCNSNSPEINIFNKKLFNFYSQNSKIPQAISEDLDIVRKKGNIIDNYIPTFTSEKDALEKVRIGDVFQIKGQKNVSIKTKEGNLEPLSMDKKSYFDLFPPVKRFTNIQPDTFGICYEVTALNAVMENPQTRENLLKSIDTISQKGKIKIKFPNSNFKDGVIVNTTEISNPSQSEYFVSGCEGIKCIQQALGQEYEKAFVDYEVQRLSALGKISEAKELKHLYDTKQTKKIVQKMNLPHNTSLGNNLREAGDAVVPWNILGFSENQTIQMGNFLPEEEAIYKWSEKYKNKNVITDENTFAEKLWDKNFFKENIVEAYVGDNSTNSKLSKWHSYRLLPVLDKKGNVESYLIKDPHGTADMEIGFDEIFETIDSISFAKIK